MGQLRNKVIQHTRSYIKPNPEPIPEYNYDIIFPITAYEAVHADLEDNSRTLKDELEAIYERIGEKQASIPGGNSGRLMTWTGIDGVIGETEIITNISDSQAERSNTKVPSERAVGTKLDAKANLTAFNVHTSDVVAHVTQEDRNEWDNMTPYEEFEEHRDNTDIHVTQTEKETWDAKADTEEVEEHVGNRNNPHVVTAHQVGSYDREEIDEMFLSIRSSFFNYKNIKYDERTNTAELVEYDAENNWNPNYILAYSDDLPTVTDQSLTYFALKPATDYSTHESQECLIYIKKPNKEWEEVGSQDLEAGDLVIRYPDTTMCVWVSGRFLTIFTGSSAGGEDSFLLWRPILTEDGVLGWTRSYETAPPDPVSIKGPAGYTPQKGVDYFDGAPGIGVPSGGVKDDVLLKSSNADYDTEWKSFAELLGEYIIEGHIVGLEVKWQDIIGKPEIVQTTGLSETDVMSQKAVSSEITSVKSDISDLQEIVGEPGGIGGLVSDLDAHVHDYNNPHHIIPSAIGAVSNDTFVLHTTDQQNPHAVTAEQVGLGYVDNTSDIDKPISAATQVALNGLKALIDEINEIIGDGNIINDVTWDDNTCTLIFTFRNGETLTATIPIIEIFSSLYFDDVDKSFVIILPDGSEHRIPIENLVTVYQGFVGTTVTVEVEGDTIKANVNSDSISGAEIVRDAELRGSPTATTQNVSDKSKKIATTEFTKNIVIDNVTSAIVDRPLSANMGLWLNQHKTTFDDVAQMIADAPSLNVVDDLESTDASSALSANMGRVLNISKAPLIHTDVSGSAYGQATANLFGHSKASSADPKMDGVANSGTDNGLYARGDHVHPSDTSRAPKDHASETTEYGIGSSTKYGHTKASSTNPVMDGTAALGTDNGVYARGDHVHPTDTSRAPKSHTSSTGSTYGQASASVFGHVKAGSDNPEMDGTASAGTDNGLFARADHVHPSDTSRAPKDHADTTTEYGVATAQKYGHVKASESNPLMDDGSGSAGTANGLYANADHKHPFDTSRAPKVHSTDNGDTYGKSSASLFGHAKATSSDPLMDGTASVGTDDGVYARGDHVHPTDTSRAPLESPEFSGVPKAPTAASGTNTTQIATTAFVQGEITAAATPIVDDLTHTDTNKALSANMGKKLNDEKAPNVHSNADGTKYGKSTASLFGHAKASSATPNMDGTASAGTDNGEFARGDHTHPTDTSRAPKSHTDANGATYGQASASVFGHVKASSANPVMDGTAAAGTDNGLYARGDHVHPTDTTRAPKSHTDANGATYGQASASLFGHTKASSSNPVMDGTASVGTDNGIYARGDHRHPTDTSRAPLASPEFTGTPKAPSAADEDSSTQIANTEWVLNNAQYGFNYIADADIIDDINEAYQEIIGE